MRTLTYLTLLLLCLLFAKTKVNAQTIKTYEKEWKKVEEWIQKKNLPQTALKEVEKIYARAKKEKQNAQIIKALMYMISLQQETREDNEQEAINTLEKERTVHKEPVLSLLQNLEAKMYWQYYQRHRWQLYNRTNTVNFDKKDIATWTAEDFHKKISELYLQSIQNEKLLQQTKLAPFDALLTKGNVRYLRPTLYDLLSYNALEYFKSDEPAIKKPAYAFEIDQAQAFAPAAQFAAYTFTTKDSLSLQHKALQIYQRLIAFHLHDARPNALLDADIQRLQFVYQHATKENKEELYKEALEYIIQKYPRQPETAQAWYLLASYYNNLAAHYKPLKDTTHRYDRIKAKKILEKVVADSAVYGAGNRLLTNEGWVNSFNLLNSITQPSFSFVVEKVNLPAQPFRALVQYKNVSGLYFRLIKRTIDPQKRAINLYEEKNWDTLLQTTPTRQWQQALPATNDLQQHAVEIKIDALPAGTYILLASDNKQFEKKQNLLGAQLFHVSSISYINKEMQFFVLHRESGQPLANAAVDVYQQAYDYKANQYNFIKSASYQTNKNGFFRIEKPKEERNGNYFIDITFGTDRLYLNDPNVRYYYYDMEEEDTQKVAQKTFFFTDRSIYRPGQTVYFKGIVLKSANKTNTIITHYTTKVYLVNANNEMVDSLTVTTNDYGSYAGKFVLPQNVLNGNFHIRDEHFSVQHFSVEEYKRPKFYVTFDKVKDSYKVNDSIRITGQAKAYAGNTITNAKVVYRVVRQPRFLYSWLRIWWPLPEPMEIAHGETTTNADGSFTIPFKAIPDAKLDKKFNPVFNYQIYADITDINGETRSGENSVTVSYSSVILKVQLPERLPVDSLKRMVIRTENMNEEFQPALVTVAISRLITEMRLIRNRYWQQPDQFVLSKQEFLSFFPHDEYKNERDYRNWEKGKPVWERTDSTDANGVWNMQNAALTPGFYVVEITTQDKEGNTVKDMRYTELYNPESKELNHPAYLWSDEKNTVLEPGQKASIQIGSSAQQVYVIRQTEGRQNENIVPDTSTNSYAFVQLNNEKKSFDFMATEADRGGFGVTFFFVKDNRFYTSPHTLQVPWTNKEINMEYTTFRDKTLPGSKEKWKVKINGYKGEKVAAEILASMYDASLDQFQLHNWNKPGIWPLFARTLVWNDNQNFTYVTSYQKGKTFSNYKPLQKKYDELLFDVLPYNEYKRMMRMPSPMQMQGNQEVVVTALGIRRKGMDEPASNIKAEDTADLNEAITIGYGTQKKQPAFSDIQPRKHFNETAFFFPDLHTDKDGSIEFSFTMPEALTKWKLQTLAHTQELAFGLAQQEVITQKKLMVQPNAPRFLREGDAIELSTKVVNMSDKELTGQASLQLLDATTNQPVDGWLQNLFPHQYFTVPAGASGVVKFPIQIPYHFNKALVWRIVAKANTASVEQSNESFADGEENVLPVLTNKMLVTETMPLRMRGTGTKDFTFEKLLQANKSETLQPYTLTFEYTSSPAWYAVQALPYLKDYPLESTDQAWNRFYAHSLARKIVHASPQIEAIFIKWKNADTAALLSNLQKNQELKAVLLEETPWVLQAKTEEQQKKNIALLFDLVHMGSELSANLTKLKQMQAPNGGFVWFKGSPDDRYITQYIVTGMGHLKKLAGIDKEYVNEVKLIAYAAMSYLDKKIKEDYEHLLKQKADLTQQHLSYPQIQYLYLRSFFPENPLPQEVQTAYNFYYRQAQQFWMKQNKYMQGMIALALYRTGDKNTPQAIVRSLKETAIVNEELGMYWKENAYGASWFWWQAPIETQALLIETFSEIGNDTTTVDNLKTWLLKNKQTNNWRTTKATAEACYALLLQGTDWLSQEPEVTIQAGTTRISNKEHNKEVGTGFFKETINGDRVTAEMGHIKVTVSAPANKNAVGATWGAVYWQYFEDLDKITAASTPLQLRKKLFIEKNTDRGPVLFPVADDTQLQVGDKLKVRIELRVDRDMEYVHMKDMRASALEPVNVLSGYRWQGGLGYYETTKDVSTQFFFNYLRKGTYVFEYPLLVAHAGNFSNGITTIQCLYAPEFSAHSEGVRINVASTISQ